MVIRGVVILFLSWSWNLLQLCKAGEIQLGQKLKVGESWISSGNTFAVGFVPAPNVPGTYNLAIWCNSVKAARTNVWTARTLDDNRQSLHFKENAQLLLTNDALIVTEESRTVWQTVIISCDQCIAEARITNTGNLMMLNDKLETLWQSFDSPTDTLLPGQQLVGSMALVSGMYSLEMDVVQVMLRYIEYPTQPYWSLTNKNLSTLDTSLDILPRLNLSADGVLTFYDGTGKPWYNSMDDNSVRYALDYGNSNVLRRLTLDSTGLLQLFSLASDNSSWNTVWKANVMECDVFGVCGAFGICSYHPERTCRCPPGFHAVNQTDYSAGCEYDVPLVSCNATTNKFIRLNRADYPWNDYNFNAKLTTSLEACKESCLRDCDCLAAAFKFQGSGLCFHKGKGGRLYNGVQSVFQNNVVFLKVSGAEEYAFVEGDAFATDVSFITLPEQTFVDKHSKNRWIYLLVLSIVIAESALLATAATIWSVWWFRHRKSSGNQIK